MTGAPRDEYGTGLLLTGGQVLSGDGLQPMGLTLAGGMIAPRAPEGARKFDARGLWLLPGIVDVHGDAIERIIVPRPDVVFSLPLVLAKADRQMLANGITTACHGRQSAGNRACAALMPRAASLPRSRRNARA